MSVDQRYEAYSDGGTFPLFVVCEAAPPGPQKPRLLDRVRVIRFDYFHHRGLALASLPKAVTFSDCDPDQPRLQPLDVL